jgi:hypothetical protein
MAVFTVIDHTEISGSSTTTWNPTSISASYDHLYLLISARSDRAAATIESLWMRFNGDSGANYSSLGLEAGSSSVGSNRNTGATKIERLPIPSDGRVTDTDIFGTIKIWIPNYANTTGYKQVLQMGAIENASTTDWQWILNPAAALWDNTAAIDEIEMFPQNGDNLKAYSTFTLYGIKGA